MTFAEAISDAEGDGGKPTVLLGNGFSIAYDKELFHYESLWSNAVFPFLDRQLTRETFDSVVETTDFETAIRRVRRAAAAVKAYDPTSPLPDRLTEHAQAIADALTTEIMKLHPNSAAELSEEKRRNVRQFLSHFCSIFTTNYDLLTYWAITGKSDGLRVPRTDGFGGSPGGPLVWSESRKQEVSFLHGALHLFEESSGNGKRLVKVTFPMVPTIKSHLEDDKRPLVVTEGRSNDKLERVLASDYLKQCHRLFGAASGALFVLGFSFDKNDDHLLDLITSPDSNVTSLYVSIHGKNEHTLQVRERALALAKRRKDRGGDKVLDIHFYDAKSARIWG
ncbi:uncharacterized protein DUF4917 [Leucobacter luti]|nr:uncharacterized protein DUF4917 [Leucobacter luti]